MSAADLVAGLKAEHPEVAFVALHGPDGEDGTVQELLELLGIPYTGPGVRGLHALRSTRSPPSTSCAIAASRRPTGSRSTRTAFRELGAADALDEIDARLGSRWWSSRLAVDPRSAFASPPARTTSPEALVAAFSYDDRVLLERHVDGRELAVSLLNGIALPAVEVLPREEDRFNYEARYEIGRTELRLPGRARRRRGPGARRGAARPGTRSASTASPGST